MDIRPVKVCLLGPVAVGKSSLVLRFASDKFTESTASTIGAAYVSKALVVDGTTYKFQIWDTAGQEKYRSLTPMYYRGAAAVIFVYDVGDAGSFESLRSMQQDVENNGAGSAVRIVVGNKIDREDRRAVSTADGEEFANSIGATFLEASALRGTNVTAIFEAIARKLPAELLQPEVTNRVNLHDTRDAGWGCSC